MSFAYILISQLFHNLRYMIKNNNKLKYIEQCIQIKIKIRNLYYDIIH